MFRTTSIQKDVLIIAGILAFSSVIILLLSPKDIADYTIADTSYWHETENRLLLKTSYEYNNIENIKTFPVNLGEWKGHDFRYSEDVYKLLNADILMSRAYTNPEGDVIWMDIINGNVGESFHNQRICVEGAGWTIENESIAEFSIANYPNPFTKLRANRMDYSKNNEKQVMVYWFMFKKFGPANAVSMIRLSTPVRYDEIYAFDTIKGFVEGELFYAMYEKANPETITIAEYILKTYGNKGMVIIALALIIPLGSVFAGVRRKN